MNLQNLMKQAQNMQKKMEEAQSKLAEKEVIGQSAGGMVEITLNCKYEMKSLNIDKSLVDADEIDVLEDLIIAAFNDAKNKVEEVMKSNMSDITGGLDLGGMKLPF
jgi:DNA-binding YbaB/EbfC family protein